MIDSFNFVLQMRDKRNHMVQTEVYTVVFTIASIPRGGLYSHLRPGSKFDEAYFLDLIALDRTIKRTLIGDTK